MKQIFGKVFYIGILLLNATAFADGKCDDPKVAAQINNLSAQAAAFGQAVPALSAQLEALAAQIQSNPDLSKYTTPDDPEGVENGTIWQDWTDQELAVFNQQFPAAASSNQAYQADQKQIDALNAQLSAIAAQVSGEPTTDQEEQLYAVYIPYATAVAQQLPVVVQIGDPLLQGLQTAALAAASAPTEQGLIRYAFTGVQMQLARQRQFELATLADNLEQMCESLQ